MVLGPVGKKQESRREGWNREWSGLGLEHGARIANRGGIANRVGHGARIGNRGDVGIHPSRKTVRDECIELIIKGMVVKNKNREERGGIANEVGLGWNTGPESRTGVESRIDWGMGPESRTYGSRQFIPKEKCEQSGKEGGTCMWYQLDP